MAAGCWGLKKGLGQGQGKSYHLPSQNGGMNGHSALYQNGVAAGMIVRPDMCCFCFDVLASHLNNGEPPKTPPFTNDS